MKKKIGKLQHVLRFGPGWEKHLSQSQSAEAALPERLGESSSASTTPDQK